MVTIQLTDEQAKFLLELTDKERGRLRLYLQGTAPPLKTVAGQAQEKLEGIRSSILKGMIEDEACSKNS